VPSLLDKYAIVGLGMIVGPNDSYEPGRTARTMETEATRLAIEDAGLTRADVDGYVHVHGGPRSGRGMSETTDAPPRVLGLPINFYYRCGRGGSWGTFGLTTALSFLEYGLANYVVVGGSRDDWSRMKGSKARGFVGQTSIARPLGTFGDPLGATNAVSQHSLFATRHMAVYGTKSEDFGAIAVQIRQWANLNPLARMYHKKMTIEDHQNTPVHVWPYHVADMAVTTDGAIAFVVTTKERAQDLAKPPVYVKGVGFGDAAGGQWWDGPSHYERLPVKVAKEKAFAMAGIELADLSMAQFYDCFTGEVLLQLEDYGFCGKGEGGSFAQGGHLGPGGSIPSNTSGGLLSAYHMADLTGISESILQLRGEAGARQLSKPAYSLVTGHGGELMSPGMCSIHSSLILGR
jgi:acetyl-CoA acetyltransferase